LTNSLILDGGRVVSPKRGGALRDPEVRFAAPNIIELPAPGALESSDEQKSKDQLRRHRARPAKMIVGACGRIESSASAKDPRAPRAPPSSSCSRPAAPGFPRLPRKDVGAVPKPIFGLGRSSFGHPWGRQRLRRKRDLAAGAAGARLAPRAGARLLVVGRADIVSRAADAAVSSGNLGTIRQLVPQSPRGDRWKDMSSRRNYMDDLVPGVFAGRAAGRIAVVAMISSAE